MNRPVAPEQQRFEAIYDPRYGSGCYRRAIVLRRQTPGCMRAAVEDDPHAFSLTLEHDGERVSGISAEARRYPLTTCPEATEELRALIGAPLNDPLRTLAHWQDPRRHCTHLYDLAMLAMSHACRDGIECRYDITIPDLRDGGSVAMLERNGETVLTWTLQDGVIVAPEPYAGRKVFGGFTAWAREALDDIALEHAFVLQRGFFVALTRMYDEDAAPPGPASLFEMPPDSCYSYRTVNAVRAWRAVGNRHDFTEVDSVELLRWFDRKE